MNEKHLGFRVHIYFMVWGLALRPGVSDGRLVREEEITEAAEAVSVAQSAAAADGTLENIPSNNCR
jgi:hypothetical protein